MRKTDRGPKSSTLLYFSQPSLLPYRSLSCPLGLDG